MRIPRPTALARILCLLAALSLGLPGCAPDAESDGSASGATSNQAAQPEDPAQFEALRNAAFRLFDAGADLAQLRDALLAASALKPEAYGVNWRLGHVYADLKLNSEALSRYEAAWAVRQDDNEVLMRVVVLQIELERNDDALALLPRLRADPELVGQALALEASLRDHLGDRPAALALVERSRGLSPAVGYRAQSLHGRFLMQAGDMAAAQERFASALAGRADYKEAVKGMADTCHRLARPDEAAHWEQVLGLLLDLTDNAYARKQLARRRVALSNMLEIYPEWAGAFQQLADLQRRAGEMDAACQTIQRYLERHGESLPPLDVVRIRQRFCGEEPP